MFTCKHKLYILFGVPDYNYELGNRDVVKILDDIVKEYKEEHPEKERNWRTYEQRIAERLKTAFKELKPLVHEAASSIKFVSGETRGGKLPRAKARGVGV